MGQLEKRKRRLGLIYVDDSICTLLAMASGLCLDRSKRSHSLMASGASGHHLRRGTALKRAVVGIYLASRIALYSGTGFDITTTEVGIHRGLRELNPILGENRIQRNVVVIGTVALTDIMTRRLRPTHPKLATVLNALIGGMHISAGFWNLQQLGH